MADAFGVQTKYLGAVGVGRHSRYVFGDSAGLITAEGAFAATVERVLSCQHPLPGPRSEGARPQLCFHPSKPATLPIPALRAKNRPVAGQPSPIRVTPCR